MQSDQSGTRGGGISAQEQIVADMLGRSQPPEISSCKADVDSGSFEWQPKRSKSDQAKAQRARIEESIAAGPAKRLKRYEWPSLKKGVSDEQATRQASGSWQRQQQQASFEQSVCGPKQFDLFSKCEIPDDDGGGVGIVCDNPDVSVEPTQCGATSSLTSTNGLSTGRGRRKSEEGQTRRWRAGSVNGQQPSSNTRRGSDGGPGMSSTTWSSARWTALRQMVSAAGRTSAFVRGSPSART